MKYADFKLAATMGGLPNGGKVITILAKKKNGLFFTYSDRAAQFTNGHGFTFSLGSTDALATLLREIPRWKVRISIPERDEIIEFLVSDPLEIKSFIDTDYYGHKI